MSGEEVEFFGDGMTAVVQAAGAVNRLLEHQPVVVGGLAVMCRLGASHRATVDLDLVERLDRDRPTQLEILRRDATTKSIEPSAVAVPTAVGMVRVDIIQVNQAEIDLPSEDAGDRLHASSHASALDTAAPVAISSVSSTGDRTVVVALVAVQGPLVAMKLQAIMNRSNGKEGTDLLDIVRLVLDRSAGPLALEQIRGSKRQMRADITQHVQHWFIRNQGQALGWVQASAGAEIEADDLSLVAELITRACDD